MVCPDVEAAVACILKMHGQNSLGGEQTRRSEGLNEYCSLDTMPSIETVVEDIACADPVPMWGRPKLYRKKRSKALYKPPGYGF